MSAWVVDAPGKPGSVVRLNWLESEYTRLGFECHYLDTVNTSLCERIEKAAEEDISGVGDAAEEDHASLDQIHLEPNEADAKVEVMRSSSKSSRLAAHARTAETMESAELEFAHTLSGSSLEEKEMAGSSSPSTFQARKMMRSMGTYANTVVMSGSALGKRRPVQLMIYLLAFGGLVFVLLATATHLGVHHEEDGHTSHGAHGEDDHVLEAVEAHGHHRRLGGAAPPLLKNIAFSLVGAGLVSFILNMVRQPLILGYLLGGVLVGPLCLGIVTGHSEIAVISKLGLVFLLFMVGMEVDFHRLWRMDRVALVVGMIHVPIGAGAMYMILCFLAELTGLHFGAGGFSILYISFTCAISSNIVVKKMLAEQFQTEMPAGRLTQGILVCQDIWALIMVACQPTISEPSVSMIVRNFVMIGFLLVAAFAYAKFVMPPVLFSASKSVELMLVLSLSWCFFICSAAILPFVHLSMELAALIAGTALATFPYSQDFNGKIKYIRDFFITLFFAGVGMQVPVPQWATLAKAVLLVVLVLAVRWLSIFALVLASGGESRQGAVATINLSQISELALVIASMGLGYYHIEEDTEAILIWAFGILSVMSTFAHGYTSTIVRAMTSIGKRVVVLARGAKERQDSMDMDGDPEVLLEDNTDIIILGFHRIASMLIAEFQLHNPQMLKRIHVIDIDGASLSTLREKGIKSTRGDFASAKELARCHNGEATLMLSTIPDSLLQGTTNLKLLKAAKSVWPSVLFVGTADNPYQAENLYKEGADYVVRMAKLCAERLHHLLSEHCTKAFGSCELDELFEEYKGQDRDARTQKGFLTLKT